jgi:hypothetical protein
MKVQRKKLWLGSGDIGFLKTPEPALDLPSWAALDPHLKFKFQLELQLQSLRWYDMILFLSMWAIKKVRHVFSKFCMVQKL